MPFAFAAKCSICGKEMECRFAHPVFSMEDVPDFVKLCDSCGEEKIGISREQLQKIVLLMRGVVVDAKVIKRIVDESYRQKTGENSEAPSYTAAALFGYHFLALDSMKAMVSELEKLLEGGHERTS